MPDQMPLSVALYLIAELYKFGDLDYTRENIEAPNTQLSREGKYIQDSLRLAGYKTREDIDELSIKLRSIFNM